jgi:translation initiation factor 1
VVTLITGVPIDGQGLHRLARQLKQLCGSGGTVRNGTIEIQGDHRRKVMEELGRLGLKVRPVGS